MLLLKIHMKLCYGSQKNLSMTLTHTGALQYLYGMKGKFICHYFPLDIKVVFKQDVAKK